MAKRKKTFFERLTELNDSYEDKQKLIKTNRRKRNWINFGILGSLGVIIIAAIAIPLGISVNRIDYVQAQAKNAAAFKFFNTNDKSKITTEMNVGDLENALESNKEANDKQIDDIYRQAVFYFYDQEQKAADEYRQIYNASLLPGENPKVASDLKSLAIIRSEKRKAINAEFESTRQSFQPNTYLDAWNKKLQTEYGNSKNIVEAVEYATFKEVETEAKRRFTIETKIISASALNRKAQRDIPHFDANGNKLQDLLYKQGDNVVPYLKENVTYFRPDANSSSIILFTTKSFIQDKIDPSALVAKYFAKNDIHITTSILLPGVANKDLLLPFSFDKDGAKDKLINILRYTSVKTADGSPILKANIDYLNNFVDIPTLYGISKSNSDVPSKQQFQFALDNLTLTKSNTLATNGITSFSDLVNLDVNQALATQTQGIFEQQANANKTSVVLPQIDLSTIYQLPKGFNPQLESLIQSDLDKAKTISESKDKSKIQEFSELVNNVNTNIKRLIDSLTSDQFSIYIKDTFNKAFAVNIDDSNKRLAFAYSIKNKPNFYLIPTDKGLMLFSDYKISKDNYNNFIKSDLLNLLAGNNTNLHITDKLSASISKEDFLLNALSDPKFVATVLNTKNPNSLTNTDYTQSDITNVESRIKVIDNGIHLSKDLDDISKINQWINDTYNKNNSLNIVYQDGQLKVGYFDLNTKKYTYSDKSAFDVIGAVVANELNKGDK
ncbi:HinT-interacting membrane complex protein P80 [Mycoplasma sp. AC1221]